MSVCVCVAKQSYNTLTTMNVDIFVLERGKWRSLRKTKWPACKKTKEKMESPKEMEEREKGSRRVVRISCHSGARAAADWLSRIDVGGLKRVGGKMRKRAGKGFVAVATRRAACTALSERGSSSGQIKKKKKRKRKSEKIFIL